MEDKTKEVLTSVDKATNALANRLSQLISKVDAKAAPEEAKELKNIAASLKAMKPISNVVVVPEDGVVIEAPEKAEKHPQPL